MRRYKKDTILLIDWIDIVQDSSWTDEDRAGIRPECDCRTVGFYLKHDKELLYMSAMIMAKQRDIITIPLGCIKKVTKL